MVSITTWAHNFENNPIAMKGAGSPPTAQEPRTDLKPSFEGLGSRVKGPVRRRIE